MDPDACLKALDEALDEKNSEGVYEYATALSEWIRGGGFNPFKDRSGYEWRANLGTTQILSYLRDLTRACGSMGE